MNPDVVLEIRRRAITGEQYLSIASSLGLNRITVRGIAVGDTHRGVSGALAPRRREEHRLSKTPEYSVWCSMVKRCTNERSRDYPRYGGAGVRVCERWRKSFTAFLADVGPRPTATHSVDRVDVHGHYEPGNVRWATDAEQRRNKRNTRLIEFRGETLCVADMARQYGLTSFVVYSRLNLGWSVERALTTPVGDGR